MAQLPEHPADNQQSMPPIHERSCSDTTKITFAQIFTGYKVYLARTQLTAPHPLLNPPPPASQIKHSLFKNYNTLNTTE